LRLSAPDTQLKQRLEHPESNARIVSGTPMSEWDFRKPKFGDRKFMPSEKWQRRLVLPNFGK
jgi:hypothetical protein